WQGRSGLRCFLGGGAMTVSGSSVETRGRAVEEACGSECYQPIPPMGESRTTAYDGRRRSPRADIGPPNEGCRAAAVLPRSLAGITIGPHDRQGEEMSARSAAGPDDPGPLILV